MANLRSTAGALLCHGFTNRLNERALSSGDLDHGSAVMRCRSRPSSRPATLVPVGPFLDAWRAVRDVRGESRPAPPQVPRWCAVRPRPARCRRAAFALRASAPVNRGRVAICLPCYKVTLGFPGCPRLRGKRVLHDLVSETPQTRLAAGAVGARRPVCGVFRACPCLCRADGAFVPDIAVEGGCGYQRGRSYSSYCHGHLSEAAAFER
jgi:hypothetical protein